MASHPLRIIGVALALFVLSGCALSAPSTATRTVASPSSIATGAPSSEPPPTSVASQSPTPRATPVASPTPAGWYAAPDQAAIRDVQLDHVVWTGARFVALGSAHYIDDTILDSVDGLMWHRQAIKLPPSKTLATSLAAGPRGVVALGYGWSPDGITWTRQAGGMVSSGKSEIQPTDVIASGDGWLAVGRQDPPCAVNCGINPVRALAWTSTDGLHWTQVADQASLKGGGMNAVASFGTGFIAAGVASGRAAIWTSADGLVWSRVPDNTMFHHRRKGLLYTTASGAASGHGVVVVVGMDQGAQDVGYGNGVRAWWSADGRTWAEASVERHLDGQAFSVASTPTGFLATGPSGNPSCVGGIWGSNDGRTWHCEAPDPASKRAFAGFGPSAAAASPSLEIAVGLTDFGYDENSGQGLPGAVFLHAIP